MNNSAKLITLKLLKELEVNIFENSIRNSFGQHPFSESLTAISDVLKEWSIDNYIIQFNNDNYEEAFSLPTPFVTFINKNNGEFILIHRMEEATIEYYSSFDHSVKCSRKDFMEKWQGVTLIPFVENREQIDNSIEYQKQAFNKFIKILSVAVLSIFVGYSIYSNSLSNFSYTIAFILALSGLLIATVLIQNEYTTNASFVNQYCSDEKSDCNVLLKSSYAKILNAVSWSELGFIYFAGNIIYLLYSDLSMGSVFALYLFAIINCTFSFYSIWHQMYISKQWCKFCLATLGIFWANFVLFSFLPKIFILSDFIKLTGSLALIATIWFSIKIIFEKYYHYWKDLMQMNKIKYRKDVFEYLLEKQLKISDTPSLFSLIKGEDTQNILTIVSNPDCEGCKTEFEYVEKYILGAYDNLQINMIFSAKKANSDGFLVANTILYIQEKEGFHNAIAALKDWYESMSINKWINKYGKEEVEHKSMKEHISWLVTNDIKISPTVVFNNYLVPDGYELSDLKYFI